MEDQNDQVELSKVTKLESSKIRLLGSNLT